MTAATRAADAGLADDLNTPVALAQVGELAKIGNDLCDAAKKRRKDVGFVAAASVIGRLVQLGLVRLCETLGVLRTPTATYAARTRKRRLDLRGLTAAGVEGQVAERLEARRQKDFARSDAIRDELEKLGVRLCDAPEGTTWSVEA